MHSGHDHILNHLVKRRSYDSAVCEGALARTYLRYLRPATTTGAFVDRRLCHIPVLAASSVGLFVAADKLSAVLHQVCHVIFSYVDFITRRSSAAR
jgi:hypothetical protein